MLSALLLAVVGSCAPPQDVAGSDAPTPTALCRVADRAGRLARDELLTFTGPTAERARDALETAKGDAEARGRPEALLALGCSGDIGDVARLEAHAMDGSPLDRRAAVFGLGELGSLGRGPLRRLIEDDPAGLEGPLVLAWILCDRAGAAPDVEAWARDATAPLHEAAGLLLDFARGGAPAAGAQMFDHWLELRWAAARLHGMVGGRRWKDQLLAELLQNEQFLDRVILGASATRDRPSVRDHLWEILLEGNRPGALPAVVVAMPEHLGAALEAGVWAPVNLEEWKIILREIEARRLERPARVLLEHAVEIRELQHLAGIQLLRAGGDLPKAWLNYEMHNAPVERRALVIEATADRGEVTRIGELQKYLQPGNHIQLQSAALIALGRLKHERSVGLLLTILEGGRTEERREVLLSIARQLHDARLSTAIADALDRADLEPEMRFLLEVQRGIHGWLRDRTNLRAWLEEGVRHPMRRDVVRAVAQRANHADLTVLRELFPVEDDLEVNIELAVALLHYREPVTQVILRRALWEGCWNRGILAGGLLEQAVSLPGLIDEVKYPPRGADEAALRRVGFAIGEWGGLNAVEQLAAQRTPTDPVLQGAYLGALSTRTH